MKLSQNAAGVEASATLAISARAGKLRAEGVDVVDFSAGQPDFDTPERIARAAHRAIDEGKTRYTPTPGIPELRQAICDITAKDYGFRPQPEQVVVSCGAKHSLYLAMMALIDPGDEVIVPTPYWVSYPPQIRLCGGVPRFVETDAKSGFKLTPESLKAALTEKTTALILNSPSNPTGQIYSTQELHALAEIVVQSGLSVICDDIYQKLIYDDAGFASLTAHGDDIREHCIIVNGVSKSAAMTGWRIGYMIAPKPIATAAARMQGQMTSNASSIAQYAALEAIGGDAAELPGWVAEFKARRDLLVEGLNAIDGIDCAMPGGAFYAFADFSGLLDRKAGEKPLNSGEAWSGYLLDAVNVATVFGEAFGAPGFVRMSFATSRERIEEGLKRIRKAVDTTSR